MRTLSPINNRNITMFFSEFLFKKLENTHCIDDEYGSYETLYTAKRACELDNKCAAIYDPSCKDQGHFALCRKGYQGKPSTASCLYQKWFASGRYY